MKKVFTLIVACSFFSHYSHAQSRVPIDEVSKHIGETVTVCDKVYGARFLENARSQPTLLNLGGGVPNQKLTIVINPEDRKKFMGKPEEAYNGKNVCVIGKLVEYKGKPEIVISSPEEIHMENGGGGLEIRTKDFLPFQ